MAGILRSLSRRFRKDNTVVVNPPANFNPKNQLLCKILLLDGSDITLAIDRNAVGNDVCNKVFEHLDLEETDYFGLQYTDHDNVQHWLDEFKKVRKQVPNSRCYTFRFQVKFFSSDPANLREEFTRYLFFLQLKNDIRTGKLPCPLEILTQLAALQLQSEFGNFNETDHNLIFVSEFRFCPNQNEDIELAISEQYKTLRGVTPSDAEQQYLDLAKSLMFYGVDMHDVLAIDNNNYRLGLTPSGVVVLDHGTVVGVLFWQFIQAVDFSHRKLTIVLDEHSANEIQQHTFVFFLATSRVCKRMWKRAVEFHTFYRKRSHRPAKRNAAEQFFRLSSSYTHRGRTEYENVHKPMRRERSVVKFERKPSQRYGPRQSHIHRLRGDPDSSTESHTHTVTSSSGNPITVVSGGGIREASTTSDSSTVTAIGIKTTAAPSVPSCAGDCEPVNITAPGSLANYAVPDKNRVSVSLQMSVTNDEGALDRTYTKETWNPYTALSDNSLSTTADSTEIAATPRSRVTAAVAELEKPVTVLPPRPVLTARNGNTQNNGATVISAAKSLSPPTPTKIPTEAKSTTAIRGSTVADGGMTKSVSSGKASQLQQPSSRIPRFGKNGKSTVEPRLSDQSEKPNGATKAPTFESRFGFNSKKAIPQPAWVKNAS